MSVLSASRRPGHSVAEAVARIRAWGEARDWRGYDPYDGLATPLAGLLTLGTPLGRRLLTQAVKLAPVNVRPLLGIRPAWNANALALVASGYARLAAATGDAEAAASARRWVSWLVDNHVGGSDGLAWGYHFDVQTRVFAYRRDTPNTIATSFAAQTLLDGTDLLGERRWLDEAGHAARFLVGRMLVRRAGRVYFGYVPDEDVLIHNANLLACAVLARTAALGGDDLRDVAAEAVRASLAAQRPDGAWPYGERRGLEWVDNFHTGYVLESLAACVELDDAVSCALERGAAFWEANLFLADGTPRYSVARTFPLDGHCYAQAIETWLALDGFRRDALGRAERAAALLVERMLEPEGYVRFQQRRRWASRVPLVRWTTAPAFRALAGVVAARAGEGERAHLD